jgi:IclR family transcriptional regulator, KDG regulon repressor
MKSRDAMTDAGANGSIRALDKAIDIIEALAARGEGLALAEVAKTAGFNASTTHHLLATLKQRGFVDQDQRTKEYRLGHRLIGLVNAFLAERDLYSAGIGPARELRDTSGETTYLAEVYGEQTIQLIELLGLKPVQCRRPKVPGQTSLHCTATGKTLLAYSPPEATTKLSALPLPKFTANTIMTLAELQTELTTIRQQGYALDREEHIAGVSCVAAPVFGGRGDCAAIISVAFPTAQAPRVTELIDLVTAAAAAISTNLGYAPALIRPHWEDELVLAR